MNPAICTRTAMPTADTSAPRYDRQTVLLHWATVVLVLALWGTAQLIDLFPKGPARYPMRSTHLLLGLLFGAVLVRRIVWRVRHGRHLAALGTPWVRAASRGVHLLLYLLLAAEVLLGLGNTWVRGDHFYTWFQIPALDPGNLPLRQVVGRLHHWTANLILALAGLHAAAALFHHVAWRDGVLRRMSLMTP